MGSCLSRKRASTSTNEGDVLLDRTIEDVFHEFNKGYTHEGKYVKMGKPRKCSYNKRTAGYDRENHKFIAKENITIGKRIRRQKSPNGSEDITPMPVELRGINRRQLRAIRANVERRCEKEGWTDREGNLLTPETVTLHDINTYIIIPYTKESESSFVETLPSTAGTQPPRFFVSHTWGETFFHTMDCIEQMFEDFKDNWNDGHDKKGGGMTEDTPIWICAFANNQHDLKNAITADPSESGFSKAMEVANYRTLSILDKDGEVFTRVWCILELDLTLIKVQEKKEKGGDNVDLDVEWNGLWAVYTAHEHTIYGVSRKAVGIVAGGAPCDVGTSYTARRERYFPMDRILKGLDTTIQTANASKEQDKRHILNYISDNVNDLDAEPPEEHYKYEALNDAVRGAFASSIAVLQSAYLGDDDWQRILTAMSKSIKKDKREFDFRAGRGWDDLSAERAVEMINHLPPSIEGLRIRSAPYGSPFMDAVIDWIEKSNNLKTLHIHTTCVGGRNGGRDTGIRLAKTLTAKNTIKSLKLFKTDMGSRNVDDWSKAFDKMTSLKELYCVGIKYDINSVDGSSLDEKTSTAFDEMTSLKWLSCVELRDYIKNVDESTFDDKTSTVPDPFDSRQRIYWNDKTFPDASMKEEDVHKLREATRATDVNIVCTATGTKMSWIQDIENLD